MRDVIGPHASAIVCKGSFKLSILAGNNNNNNNPLGHPMPYASGKEDMTL
jgi:hypothetical protein